MGGVSLRSLRASATANHPRTQARAAQLSAATRRCRSGGQPRTARESRKGSPDRAVEADRTELGKTKDDFEFFLAFANEIMDGYGRLLGYLNRDQPRNGTTRPSSYNERLLETGLVTPYFIWPNVEPFPQSQRGRRRGAQARHSGQSRGQGSLGRARQWVKQARQQQVGVFDANDPLRLDPFELRFLARRQPPTRWLINLAATDDRVIPPQKYHTVNDSEDRLWIPDEYLSLWVEKGWRRGR